MKIYKFRILFEDNENFFREIEIKANQTFEDFHKIMLESADFDNSEMASFYVCDANWNRQEEITLCNMINEEFYDEDYLKQDEAPMPITCMSDRKLMEVVTDPHQRMLYVYDFLNLHTFYIELHNVITAETTKNYPCIVKSRGKLTLVKNIAAISDDFNNEDMLFKEDYSEMIGNDNLSYGDNLLDGLYDDTSYN